MAATDPRTAFRQGLRALSRTRFVRALVHARSMRALIHAVGVTLGLFGHHAARAAELPADTAEAMVHSYRGGGIAANGPALLVRKKLADSVSVSGNYYVDMVSNASIDVVTTASPFKETRTAFDLAVEHVVRDTTMKLGRSSSREPDYTADAFTLDLTQEVFGNMTTANLGFTRATDKVGRSDVGFFDRARHWQYRLGLAQVMSPTWVFGANFEAIADDGYLGNPYRAARVFGASVGERVPRTRSSRALALRTVHHLGEGRSVRAEYRYFWDTWAIKAHTVELTYSQSLGSTWLGDAYVRLHRQGSALFYSDNAQAEMLYLTRNRQLSAFTSPSLGFKMSTTMKGALRGADVKFTGAIELKQFSYADFTDLRTGERYKHNAALMQAMVSVNF